MDEPAAPGFWAEPGGPNPFLAGNAEWNDRLLQGSKNGHAWKAAFFMVTGILGIAVAGLSVMGNQSRIEPHLAVVDRLNYDVQVVGPVSAVTLNDKMMQGVIRREVTDLVIGLRGVIGDRVAQKKIMESVYSHVAANSAAAKVVTEWYAEHNPLKSADSSSVAVELDNPLPLSDKSFQLEWSEVERALNGEVLGCSRWKGIVSYAINPPTKAAEFDKNPIGWYATRLEWSKIPGTGCPASVGTVPPRLPYSS